MQVQLLLLQSEEENSVYKHTWILSDWPGVFPASSSDTASVVQHSPGLWSSFTLVINSVSQRGFPSLGMNT